MPRLMSLLVALAFAMTSVSPLLAQQPAAKSDKAAASTTKERLDINSASEEQLKALPGITEAYAKKIVEGRPYARKVDLVTRKVVPQTTYDKIKGQIAARRK